MRPESFFRTDETNALNRINIVNFVDVALTLVVILMMISPLIEQGLEVKLPSAGPSRISVQKSLIVTVASGNRIYAGSTQVSLDELKKMLANAVADNPETGVIVKGDRAITYQELVRVLDAIKRANVTRVGLATEVER
jgi:biopolymer transport protein ExbD